MWSVRGEAGVRFILFYYAKKGEINEPLFAKSPVRKSLGIGFSHRNEFSFYMAFKVKISVFSYQ